MSSRTRPRSHTERSTAKSAVDSFCAAAATDPDARAAEQRIFHAAALAWAGAWTAHREASALAALASAEADVADGAFDDAARCWASTVRDDKGRSLVGRLGALTGGLAISDLCLLPYGEEARRMTDLLAKLPGHPELTGDPGRLAALTAATAALLPLTVEDERAIRVRLARGRELEEASAAFDAAYVRLYRSFVSLLGESATRELLPVFEGRPTREAVAPAPTEVAG